MATKKYAVVLADGTSEEVRDKKTAIAAGEASGQGFTVLSPRGFEVYVGEAKAPEPRFVMAEELEVGQTVVGRGRQPVRTIAALRVGRLWINAWSSDQMIDGEVKGSGGFLYVKRGTLVEVRD